MTTFPPRHACRSAGLVMCLVASLAAGNAWAVSPEPPDPKAFFKPELYISTSSVELSEALPQLANRAAWEAFYGRRGEDLKDPRTPAWIDPRSGAAVNILLSEPILAGAREVTPAAVGRLVRQYVVAHRDVLGIDPWQLGEPVAHEATSGLWHVSMPQRFEGVPVRYGRVLATITKGNLVLLGTETWGDVRDLTTQPRLAAGPALQAGYNHMQALATDVEVLREPRLEIIPYAPPELQQGEGYGGPLGEGYRHRLAWTYVLKQPGEIAEYEAIVDADTGELLSFQDVVEYVERQVRGGVYPLTNNGTCGNPAQCGSLQPLTPMPFADTGLAAPNNFTNSAGVFNWTSGPVSTTLTGRFVDVVDRCGAISESAPTGGNLNLGGANGQHDCTASGSSDGNTAASRTAYYELNRIQEMARGWLPNNTWLGSRLIANVNLTQTCTAFFNGSVNFVRSGAGCGNTGELAAVMHHEWGHGMDRNDSGGNSSNPGEAYADMAALVRTQNSCVADGLWVTRDNGCGRASNGQMNTNMADRGLHCAVDCSGKRETDWTKHADGRPDTPLAFVCPSCNTGGGPCGREVHCAAAPSTQSLWDLAVRDLRAAPFNLDAQTAWITAGRLYFVGSGNVGAWHSCTCGGTASGCAAANGYMQWLAADDDNGSLADGTPHMTAIFNAFSRHGIACSTPAPRNGGCASGPTAPVLTATPGNFRNALSWPAVPGAQRYWVFKTEGPAGCDYGKARIATLSASTTTFTDTQVANGRQYSYNVLAVGASDACFSPASACVQATPTEGSPAPDFQVSVSPAAVSVAQGGSGTATATVSSVNGFNNVVSLACGTLPAGVTCTFNPASVTPPANGTAASTLTIDAAPEAAAGTSIVQVSGSSGALTRTTALSVTVTPVGGPGVVFSDTFQTNLGWTRNPSGTDRATTGLWQRGVAQPTASGGTGLQIAALSPTFDLVTGATAGASAGTNDVDGGVTSILSPPVTLPGGGTLTLSFASYLAHLGNATAADFLRVTVVGATSLVVLNQPGAPVNRAGVWSTTTADITAFAGQTIRILVEAADNGTASLIEAGVDDVAITRQ